MARRTTTDAANFRQIVALLGDAPAPVTRRWIERPADPQQLPPQVVPPGPAPDAAAGVSGTICAVATERAPG